MILPFISEAFENLKANDEGSVTANIVVATKITKKETDEIIKNLEKKLNKKIVTLVWDFEKFYQAENYHQDYYEKNCIRYLMYKKGCQREETLKKIWN